MLSMSAHGSQRSRPCVFFSCSPPYFLRQSLPRIWDLPVAITLTPNPSPQRLVLWIRITTLGFPPDWGSEPSSSCFLGRHCTKRAASPALLPALEFLLASWDHPAPKVFWSLFMSSVQHCLRGRSKRFSLCK